MAYAQNGVLFGHKKNEVLIHGTIGMNLENIMQSERSQTQKTIYCMIPFVGNV